VGHVQSHSGSKRGQFQLISAGHQGTRSRRPAAAGQVNTPAQALTSPRRLCAIKSLALIGVTEVRAGVFMFGDLFQAGVGAVAMEDIALSVLATVIGHQRARGWIITDAGCMAASHDRGTARQKVDQGYGAVCDLGGKPYPDLIVADANQEHGIVTLRRGSRGAARSAGRRAPAHPAHRRLRHGRAARPLPHP